MVIFLDNLHAALDAPTALNVTVQATHRREAVQPLLEALARTH